MKLDTDFSELIRISGQIERLEFQSDSGLERALKLLTQFAQHGQNITEGIQEFSQALQSARENSEKAATLVAERAQEVQQRKQTRDAMQEKIGQLGSKVKQLNETLSTAREPEQLNALDSHLAAFIEEARTIKQEAAELNLKEIARNAESLFGTLQSARAKLSPVIATMH